MKKIALCFCCLAMAFVTWAQNNLPFTPVYDPANPQPYILAVPKVLPEGYKYTPPMVTMLMDVGYVEPSSSSKESDSVFNSSFDALKNVIIVSFAEMIFQNAAISLVNEQGKLLYQNSIEVNREMMIDASDLPSGIYFLNFNYTNATNEVNQLKQTVHLVR